MPLTYITHTLNSTERKAVRDEIIELFLLESPGTGKEELCSKYEYTVETIDEYSIFLRRPASLNKGFDFTVHVKGMNFKKNRTYSNPSHSDILNKESVVVFHEDSTKGYLKELEGFHSGVVMLAEYCYKKGIDVPIYVTYLKLDSKAYVIDEPVNYSFLASTKESIP